MSKYEAGARELLKLVGGKENIAAVSHCMTRMRFALAEPGKADVLPLKIMRMILKATAGGSIRTAPISMNT